MIGTEVGDVEVEGTRVSTTPDDRVDDRADDRVDGRASDPAGDHVDGRASDPAGDRAGDPQGDREGDHVAGPGGTTRAARVRVALPAHLRTLARVDGEVAVDVVRPVTLASVVDALETTWPVLGGTIRDRAGGTRRAFVRFFVGEDDRSHDAMDAPLPEAVARGETPVRIVGAMAGG